MQAESSKQTAANTTGKKRLRSSSGFQINTEAQSEVPKRQCLDDVSQAYTSLEESFRVVKAKSSTKGEPELTGEQQVLINKQYQEANVPAVTSDFVPIPRTGNVDQRAGNTQNGSGHSIRSSNSKVS
jgi:hypothetical protein